MTVTTYYCDLCNNEISNPDDEEKIRIYPKPKDGWETFTSWGSLELCKVCESKFIDLLKELQGYKK